MPQASVPDRPHLAGIDLPQARTERIARLHGLAPVREDGEPADIVIVGSGHGDGIGQALGSGAGAVVEIDGDDSLPASSLGFSRGGSALHLSLLTATAYSVETAYLTVQALIRRGVIADSARSAVELAFHEAVTNAIVHGNLGIKRGPADDPTSFSRFFQEVQSRLARPEVARRRVAVTATWGKGFVELTVADEGAGYDVGHIVDAGVEAKSGRGLQIMRELSTAIAVSDGGRCLTLRFAR